MGGHAKSLCKGPGCGARALGRIFANDLSHSLYNTESLKPHCEGGVSNPIFLMRKQADRFSFALSFVPSLQIGYPNALGTHWSWDVTVTQIELALPWGSQTW